VKAQEDVGFAPLLAFPDFKKDYQSNELFPLFKNRVISPKRTDFQEYIDSTWIVVIQIRSQSSRSREESE